MAVSFVLLLTPGTFAQAQGAVGQQGGGQAGGAEPEITPLEGAPPAGAPAEADQAPSLPEDVADASVRQWLSRSPASFDTLARLDTEQLCRELPGLLVDPAPPAGTVVRFDDRLEQPAASADERVFTYAAVRPGDQLDVVEVRLRQVEDEWRSERVGFRSLSELSGVRAWLQTPAAAWFFVAFTLLVLVLLINPASILRRGLRNTFAAIAEHRRLVIVTVLFLYAMFALGALSGRALPEACDAAILEVVTTAITTLGAADAYGSGDVPRAAATTFYQNFVMVTVSVTFTLALLLGVPAYLFAAFSFFVQGVPFGLVSGATWIELLYLAVLIVLELTAYFLVVAGGGMLLSTIWRRGFGSFGVGARKLLAMLPLAMLFLLVGAWYEAAGIILLGL